MTQQFVGGDDIDEDLVVLSGPRSSGFVHGDICASTDGYFLCVSHR